VDKVEGYATEAEAVERGMELLESKKLWAVVSFVDLGDKNTTLDKLPPFVTYKIRYVFILLHSIMNIKDTPLCV
jgi:ATP-binding cassette subfamily A (ABC1) protein 1